MFIKRDRFLGKFKKDPPHIGEYIKNDIFSEENRLWFYTYDTTRGIRIRKIRKYNTNTKILKYEKYENTSRKNKILLIILLIYMDFRICIVS